MVSSLRITTCFINCDAESDSPGGSVAGHRKLGQCGKVIRGNIKAFLAKDNAQGGKHKGKKKNDSLKNRWL